MYSDGSVVIGGKTALPRRTRAFRRPGDVAYRLGGQATAERLDALPRQPYRTRFRAADKTDRTG
jgi:hypothetical protein